MHKSVVTLIFIAILLGGIILSVALIDESPEPSSKPTSEPTEDEETELTPKQQLKEKIKEVATIIKQRDEIRTLMLSTQGVGF